jgi:hypothetical protein
MSFALQITVIGPTGSELAKGFLTDPSPTHEEAYNRQLELWNDGFSDATVTFKDGQQVFIVGAELLKQSVVKLEIVEA